ncbi:MAG: hypothetical protein ACREUZ_21775, partial [Burkholderiales bacterium]
ATATMASANVARCTNAFSIRCVLFIVISEPQRGGHRRGVVRRLATAPGRGLNVEVKLLERIG